MEIRESAGGNCSLDQNTTFTGTCPTTSSSPFQNLVSQVNVLIYSSKRVIYHSRFFSCPHEINARDAHVKQMLENSPIGVAILETGTGERLFANNMLAKMLGAESVDELIDRDISETWAHEEDLRFAFSTFQKHEQLVNFEAERKRLDGSKWWVLMNSQPTFFEGKDAGIVWHVDITERKNQERLADNLFVAIESLSEGVTLFDAEDRLLYVNKSWRVMDSAVPENHVEGTAFKDHLKVLVERGLAPGARGREEEWIVERLYRRQNPTGPFELQRDDVQLLVNEQRLSDGGTATLYTDITALKQTETDLQNALVDAERANQAKSEFLASMSHELRTPLNAIIGFSEMITEEVLGSIGNDRYQEYMLDIHNSGHHLLHLVNDVLDLEKIEAGQLALYEDVINIDDLLTYCLRMIKGRKEAASISFLYEPVKDLPTVYVDERILKQIVLNPLANAVKYNNTNGTITLSAQLDDDKGISIFVSDTGVGISPEHIPVVLEPFGQARTNAHLAHEGTGLGLSLSRQLIELHGGALEIESEVDRGTTVTIKLPPERVVSG
jgi:PAS domain S-box-containing protein